MTDSKNASVETRIDAIEWYQFETAYGPADDVGSKLKSLFSGNVDAAADASHELWCGLCHQHAYLSSTALPAFPFLLEAVCLDNEKLTVEILDIFYGFAACTNSEPTTLTNWQIELREILIKQLPLFSKLTSSEVDDVRDFAELIVEELGS